MATDYDWPCRYTCGPRGERCGRRGTYVFVRWTTDRHRLPAHEMLALCPEHAHECEGLGYPLEPLLRHDAPAGD